MVRKEGNVFQVRRLRIDGRAHFIFESVGNQALFMPLKYNQRGLYCAYLSSKADIYVASWPIFSRVLNEMKNFAVSNPKRGLCDACFVYRQFLCTLKTQEILDNNSRYYAVHLSYAEVMLQQYRTSKSIANIEWAKECPHIVVLALYYARQIGVQQLGNDTTECFWANTKVFGVNMFGIVNNGAGQHGFWHGSQYVVPLHQ